MGNRWSSRYFGNAHVMAFQAPDTWYYAQKGGLLEKAYNELSIKDFPDGERIKFIAALGASVR